MADTVDSKRVSEYNEEDTPGFQKKLDQLAAMVKKSKYTVFYTGAGVSTSAGVGDYRGPSGAWTNRKIKQLEASFHRTPEEDQELIELKKQRDIEIKKATKKVDMMDAQPTPTHMAQATLIRHGIAHYVVTTNLDGIYRKAGLQGHTQLCCLHGDVYIERCTSCGYDFERNYHTRQDYLHVHDHSLGDCSRCGSKRPSSYKGTPQGQKMKRSQWPGLVMVGTRDVNCGIKDTHINFGECLDSMDWDEADQHCTKADLVIIAGTSMSLRHITHFPFLAKKVVLINLQATPDDEKANLRIWAKCDPVFIGLMERLKIPIDPIPVWRPRDAVPIAKIPNTVHRYYIQKAQDLEEMIKFREAEAEDRRTEIVRQKIQQWNFSECCFEIGNTHQKMESANASSNSPNQHEWKMFVRLAPTLASQGIQITDLVDYVQFKLHPTFSPSVIKIGKAPFELSRIGWGTFDVKVKIVFKPSVSSVPFRYKHRLDFSQQENKQSVVPIQIPKLLNPTPVDSLSENSH